MNLKTEESMLMGITDFQEMILRNKIHEKLSESGEKKKQQILTGRICISYAKI